jgi:hypothetical protein
MGIIKVFAVLSTVFLACQLICGFYLANHPEILALGRNDFHMILGIVIFCLTTAATVGLFLVTKKNRKG